MPGDRFGEVADRRRGAWAHRAKRIGEKTQWFSKWHREQRSSRVAQTPRHLVPCALPASPASLRVRTSTEAIGAFGMCRLGDRQALPHSLANLQMYRMPSPGLTAPPPPSRIFLPSRNANCVIRTRDARMYSICSQS